MAARHRSHAFLAVAALAAALCLSGCGVPQFVTDYCQDSLVTYLGQPSVDANNMVQAQCQKTYLANSQINQCIYKGQDVLKAAKSLALPSFVTQCTNYVQATVCGKGSTCTNPSNITLSQATSAVSTFITYNYQDLAVKIRTALNKQIKTIITTQYDTKFATRAVPMTIQAQCQYIIDSKIANLASTSPGVLVPAITKGWGVCNALGRTNVGKTQCSQKSVSDIIAAKARLERKFTMKCARTALAKACPPGSPCAINTTTADPVQTHLFIVFFISRSFNPWTKSLKTSLMNIANSARPPLIMNVQMCEHFTLPSWLGTGGTLGNWASFGALAFVSGCVVGMAHFKRRRPVLDRFDSEFDLIPLE